MPLPSKPLSGSSWVRVCASTASAASSPRTVLSSAIVKAGTTALAKKLSDTLGRCNSGRERGMPSSVGTSLSQATLSNVPASNAATMAGRNLRHRLGHNSETPSATNPISSVPESKASSASGQLRMAFNGLVILTGSPKNALNIEMTIITPIPDVKPAITEYGV